MELHCKMLKLGENPNGVLGEILGLIMNLSHRTVYLWAIGKMKCLQHERILDVGCGAGKAVETICKNLHSSTVYGIDHSRKMIKMARKMNRRNINHRFSLYL